jgi:transaldolase
MHAAHSRDETVRDALDIVDIYKRLSPGLSTDRICIKIPATYEGLEACRILEAQGIKTLATTLFSVEQAILAHEVGCEYVAPYVNELKVR